MKQNLAYISYLPFLALILTDILHRDSATIQFVTFLIYLGCIFFNIELLFKNRTPLINATLLYLLMVLVYELIYEKLDPIYNPYDRLLYLEWPLVGILAWICGKSNAAIFNTTNTKVLLFLISFYILFASFNIWRVRDSFILKTVDETLANFSLTIPYTLLWMAVVMFIFNDKIKKVGVLIIFLTILITLKRGPIIALSLGLLTAYFVNNRVSIKKIVKIAVPVAIILVIVSNVFSDNLSAFITRFTGTETNGDVTAGRNLIFAAVLSSWLEAPIETKLFGFGFEYSHIIISFSQYGKALGSHNDYLEILCNFGIFGEVVFVTMLLNWIRCCIKAVKLNFQYKNLMIIGVTSFIISCCFTSHLCRMPTDIFMFFFYYTCSILENKIKENKQYEHTKNYC